MNLAHQKLKRTRTEWIMMNMTYPQRVRRCAIILNFILLLSFWYGYLNDYLNQCQGNLAYEDDGLGIMYFERNAFVLSITYSTATTLIRMYFLTTPV